MDGDAGLVEAQHHGLGLDAGHPQAHEVGEPVDGIAQDHGARAEPTLGHRRHHPSRPKAGLWSRAR